MFEDKAIEYATELQFVKITLENIKSLGIDITEFNNQFKSLEEQTSKDIAKIQENDNGTVKKLLIDQTYTIAIKKITEFKESLNHYNLYFKTISKCSYIDSVLEDEIDKDILNQIIADLIKCLKSVRNSEAINYADEELAVNRLYETAYRLIKLEIKINDSTTLIDYCKQYRIDSVFISKLILDEIKQLQTDGFNTDNIERILNGLKSIESDSIYLDTSLVKAILGCKFETQLKNNLLNDINSMYNKLSENLNVVTKLESTRQKEQSRYDEERKEMRTTIKKCKTKISLSITSIVLSVAVIVGLAVGAFKLSKNLSKEKKHYTTKTTYSSDTDIITTSEDYLQDLYEGTDTYDVNEEHPNEQVILTIYEPWQKSFSQFKRDTIAYDLTDIKFDNIKDYLSLNLDELGRKGQKESEYKDELSLSDLYSESITQIIKQVQNDENYTEEIDPYVLSTILIFLYGGLGIIITICECYWYNEEINIGISCPIITIKDYIDRIKSEKRFCSNRISSLLGEIDKLSNEIDSVIENNEQIKARFYELYNQTEYRNLIVKYQNTINLLKLIKENDDICSVKPKVLNKKKTNEE